MKEIWALGVDLGGTKLEVARVDEDGTIRDSMRMPTNVEGGPGVIERDITDMAGVLKGRAGIPPVGIGVGIAGQIEEATGIVLFSPNLGWHEVPLLADLHICWICQRPLPTTYERLPWGSGFTGQAAA